MKLSFLLLFLSLCGNKTSLQGKLRPNRALSDTAAYRSFVVDSRSEKVVLYARQTQIDNHTTLLMATNGGMYDPDYSAHGLLVVGGKVFKKLDTKHAKGANFYVRPNGVFLKDVHGYAVVTTPEYQRLYSQWCPEFATQSGPMLICNDTINTIFDKQSEYWNTRSGVGILPNGEPVFIIAENINFYDFASIFKNKFHCRNALFLDGGISEMFIGVEEVGRLKECNFGPVIVVLKK